MSTATTTTAENAGLPAMLDTKDVAEMFKRMQKVSEAGAAKDRMVVLGLVCL